MAAAPKTAAPDVNNMTCPVYPITVKKSLEKVAGASAVKVDFVRKSSPCDLQSGQNKVRGANPLTTNAGFPSAIEK